MMAASLAALILTLQKEETAGVEPSSNQTKTQPLTPFSSVRGGALEHTHTHTIGNCAPTLVALWINSKPTVRWT